MQRHRYSLMRGGLVHRLLEAIGALHTNTRLSCWIAATAVAFAALPPLLLCWRSGTLWSSPGQMGLLEDYATASRLVLALPLLILAAPRADALLHQAFRQLSRSSVVHPRRQAQLKALLERIHRWRDSWLPEVLCVLLALAPMLLGGTAVNLLPGLGDWRLDGTNLSAAGRSYEWLSAPLFRLIALLWLWRFVLWSLLLWGLPRNGLVIHAEHPDGAGGLAFLGVAQERFAVLALAGGLLICGACLNHMHYLGDTLAGMRHLLAGFVVVATVLLVAPLLLLMPAMTRAKRHAIYRFSALGTAAAESFDQRWQPNGADGAAPGSLLDHGDASSMADFNSVYQTLDSMSVLPITRWNLLWIALHAMLPLLPLVLLAMSVDELVTKLVGILV